MAGPDLDELQERQAIRSLFDHWLKPPPALFPEALDCAKQANAGAGLPPPDSLLPPSVEPARSLWLRLLDASGSAPTLVEVTP